jgi:hypothetical protein
MGAASRTQVGTATPHEVHHGKRDDEEQDWMYGEAQNYGNCRDDQGH